MWAVRAVSKPPNPVGGLQQQFLGRHQPSLAVPSTSAERRTMRRHISPKAGKGFGKKVEKVQEDIVETQVESTSSVEMEVEMPDVPEEVTDRALTRMLTFSGIPFAVGLIFFPLFWYLKVIKKIDIPTWTVYAVSTFFLGGSLAGISYGLLSTSGSPNQKDFLGFDNFKKNVDEITGKKD